MTRLVAVACSLVLGVAAAACTGTETGNPPFAAELGIDAHSSDVTIAALHTPEGGAVIDQAWLSLGDMGMVEDGLCGEPVAPPVDVPAPGVGDHAGPGHLREMFTLSATHYCALSVSFVVAPTDLPAGAPPELDGAVLAIVGRTAAGADFLIVSGTPVDVDVAALDAFFVLEDGDASVFLGFDVAAWLSGVDLDSATPDAGGRIVVSATDNPDLLAAFQANFARGLELYRDADRDGVPDTPGVPLARGAP